MAGPSDPPPTRPHSMLDSIETHAQELMKLLPHSPRPKAIADAVTELRKAGDIMSPALLLLAADLLELASRAFGNHGCNDYDLPRDMKAGDIESLAALCNRWNFQNVDPANVDPDELKTAKDLRRGASDFVIMSALAFGLREMAKR